MSFCLISSSETITWTWSSGNDTVNVTGNYDIEPIFPGARFSSVSWMDNPSQALYLFGGYNGIGHFNDLWSFSLESKEWSIVFGDEVTNGNGNYIDKGNESNGYPGSRYGSSSWMDEENQMLWLYGGAKFGDKFDDIWSYSLENNKWTWVYGNSVPNISASHVELLEPGNPGSRIETTSIMDKTNKKLWLFGGRTFLSVFWNDLWFFSIDNEEKEMIWASGSNSSNIPGFYEEKGVPSPNTYPGSRSDSISWMDDSNQKLWIFGGFGWDNSSGFAYLNDLWSYSIVDDMWTWVSGDLVGNSEGNYVDKGFPSNESYPCGRSGSISWFDKKNNKLWLFGGNGRADEVYIRYNDLWSYSIDNDTWTWVSGGESGNEAGIFGNLGESSKDFNPGGRSDSISWTDESNKNFYLFGGIGYGKTINEGTLNDLWSFSIEGDSPIEDFPIENPNPTYDGIRCNTSSCYIEEEIYINNTIIVGDDLIITNSSIIIIPIIDNNGIIINHGDNPIIINGGKIIIDIKNEVEYNELVDNLKTNKSYEIILINGKYNGSFDSIELQSTSSRCEKVIPELIDNQDKSIYSIRFNVNESSCKKNLKWWIILLICLGILLVLGAIFVILVIKIKPLKNKLLPFR